MFKSIVIGVASLAAFVSANAECTLTREVKCVDDIRSAYPVCQKAA